MRETIEWVSRKCAKVFERVERGTTKKNIPVMNEALQFDAAASFVSLTIWPATSNYCDLVGLSLVCLPTFGDNIPTKTQTHTKKFLIRTLLVLAKRLQSIPPTAPHPPNWPLPSAPLEVAMSRNYCDLWLNPSRVIPSVNNYFLVGTRTSFSLKGMGFFFFFLI